MKNFMLVGTIGFALVCIAKTAHGEVPLSATSIKSARDAAVGTAGSAQRAEVLAQLQAGVANGDIDPATVLFLIDENLLPGSGGAVNLSGGGAAVTEGVSTTPNTLFYDPFGTYTLANFLAPPGSQNPIMGQINPAVFPYGFSAGVYGVADDTTMTEGDNNPFTNPFIPPPGGGIPPLPAVNQGVGFGIDNTPPYLALARRTGRDARERRFRLGMSVVLPCGIPGALPDEHLRLKTDWYLTDVKTSQWWSPVSFTEGVIANRVFFGGKRPKGALRRFARPFPGRTLQNFVSLGNLPGNFQIGQFYAPPVDPLFPFPVKKWFEIMTVLAQDPGGGVISTGTYVKTPDTIANGFLDPRMASGAIVPVDGEPAGWVNVYPGVMDNPFTAGVIEGVGIARTRWNTLAATTGSLGLAPPLAATSLNGLQIGRGLDRRPSTRQDAFVDDVLLAGLPLIKPVCTNPFTIPYLEDMECYFPGPIRPQTTRIFDALSSNAIITTTLNTTLGGSQSLGHISLNNDDIYRLEDAVIFPTFPDAVFGTLGLDGLPFTGDTGEQSAVVSAQVRVGVTNRTGNAIRVFDGAFTGNYVGTILLGARDPNAALAASDGRVWIRQPNVGSNGVWSVAPGFDSSKSGQDNLSRGNYFPASQWSAPLSSALAVGELDFNNQFTNIPTGALTNGSDGIPVVLNTFTDITFEVQPNPGQDPNNPYDEGLMRVSYNGAVIPNPARIDGLWLAGSAGVSDIQFWSGNEPQGFIDTFHVDDVTLDGPLRVVPPGPPFTPPYIDSFELYNCPTCLMQPIAGKGDTPPLNIIEGISNRPQYIDGLGSTPYLNLASLADNPTSSTARVLTLSTNPPPTLVAGTTQVCRYMVDSVDLASGLLNIGDTVAMDYSDLPLPFNSLLAQNINCPGAAGISTPFVLRPFNVALGTAENQPALESGNWTLLNSQAGSPATQNPEPYDPLTNPTDVTLYSYSVTTAPRWTGDGPAALIVTDPTGGGHGQVILIKSTFSVDGSLNDNPDFLAASALLPQVASDPGNFATPSTEAVSQVDLYIESLDAAGNLVNAAPRSRMSLPIVGAGADSGRITTLNFGGPNVNNDETLQGPPLTAPIIPDDEISFMVPSGLDSPDTMFVSTGVSLTAGGLGLPSLVNTWIRVTCTVRSDSTWSVSIQVGASAPVTIAAGTAIDLGLIGIAGIVNTNSLDSFEIRQGRDLGSDGAPIPTDFRIRTLVNNAVVANPQTGSHDVTAPSNADKDADYCFYQTTTTPEFEIDVPDGPLNAKIADESATIAEEFSVVRDLDSGNDVLAVVNRAYDSTTNTVSGPLLFNPCPLNVTAPINRFSLYDGPGGAGTILYTGRWGLLGQVGQPGFDNPTPAGGLGRIDGPARPSPVSYNDLSAAPSGFPSTLASRPIIVCQWGSDGADANLGVDPPGSVFPQSRWFVDNVSLDTIVGPTPCADLTPGDGLNAVNASDLAFLLGQWGGPGTGDLNGDGIVNAADLAILLGLWGPCP